MSNLEILRRWKLLTQEQLGTGIGVSRRTIQAWECNPTRLNKVAIDLLDQLTVALSPMPDGRPVTISHLRELEPVIGQHA